MGSKHFSGTGIKIFRIFSPATLELEDFANEVVFITDVGKQVWNFN